MRLLFTQRALEDFAGTELVTAELCRRFAERGADVAVYCPKPGQIARLIAPSGVVVTSDLSEIPIKPDVIHAHHHLTAMAALAHFEDVPAVYYWHGVRPWVEQPPVHPRIPFYAVASDKMAPQLTARLGIPADRIVTVPNFIDPDRFSFVRTPRERPKRAIFFGRQLYEPDQLAWLDAVCAENGITLDKVGPAANNSRSRPEGFLPDYDLAFAIGRSALEAMASGCAVIPVVSNLAGNLVTTENFNNWSNSNFSPRYFTSGNRVTVEWLAEELTKYSSAEIARTTALAREHHSLPRIVDLLESLYARAVAAKPQPCRGEASAHYLSKIAREADDLWVKAEELGVVGQFEISG